MPAFDFWDIDEVLAEQQEVTVKPNHDILGGGLLCQTSTAVRQRDLPKNTKTQVPFWLAQLFARRNTAEIDLPSMYNQASQENLAADPTVCRLGDDSQYYFEVGCRLAALLKEQQLGEELLTGLQRRWCEIVTLLGKLGVARTHASPLNPSSSVFPQTLTAVEQEMFFGGREAERHFQQWTNNFATYKMRASQVAEVRAAKRPRTG